MISTGSTQKHLEMDYKREKANRNSLEIYLKPHGEIQLSPQHPIDDRAGIVKNFTLN
jgi:hypothetical protein